MVISEESMKYSLRNLRMRKARSILTILSIFVGIATIFIFISFGWGLFNYINDLATGSAADKIIVQNKGTNAAGLDNTFQLTDDDLRAVRKVTGVYEATGVGIGVAEIQKKNEKKFNFISGYDPKTPMLFDISDVGIEKGKFLTSGDNKKILLGYNYLIPDKIFSEALDIGDSVELQGEKVRVVGFVEEIGSPSDDAAIYITKEYMEELYPETVGEHGWIIAKVDINNIDQIVEKVEREVRKSKGQEEGKEDFYVQSFEDLIESFSGALNIVIGFVILIALISVIVSAVNTANTMITSVLERTREIGVIKSIGAKNSEVLQIFLFESATLGFVAGAIGVIVGWLLTSLAESILQNLGFGFLAPAYSFWLFAGLILFATLTGAISGAAPAYRASRIKPVDALRYE
jgi:putative ABC transport system permease protein